MSADTPEHRIRLLCQRFGYPEPIREALTGVCTVLGTLTPRAVLLVGSAARGELTFRRSYGGRLEMFSDLELFCLVDSTHAGAVERVQRQIRQLETELFVPNGLFHLDCLITRSVSRGRAGGGLLWYEGGRTFQVLMGPEEEYFGSVDPSSLSLELVNQLVIIRLWWLLVYFPSWLLRGADAANSLGGPDRDALLYTQVRNLLDVLSIWLPNEGVIECGYAARLNHLRHYSGALSGTRYLPEAFPEQVEEATRKKLTCDLSGDPLVWYERVVAAYEGLLGLLLEVPRSSLEVELTRAIERDWARRYPPPRSWKFRAYAALLSGWAASSGAGIRWLRTREDPEGAALAFLIDMHRAAVRRLEGDHRAAARHLRSAGDALWSFTGNRVTLADLDEGTFAVKWHTMRSLFAPRFTRYFRQVRGQAEAVDARLRRDQEILLA